MCQSQLVFAEIFRGFVILYPVMIVFNIGVVDPAQIAKLEFISLYDFLDAVLSEVGWAWSWICCSFLILGSEAECYHRK